MPWKEMDQRPVSPGGRNVAKSIALFLVQGELVHYLRAKAAAQGRNRKARWHVCEMYESRLRQDHANRCGLSKVATLS